MARVYFHCSGTQEVLVDRRGSELDGMSDMHQHAVLVAQSLLATSGAEDWRDWMVHVSDEEGEELFLLPFSTVLGRPH